MPTLLTHTDAYRYKHSSKSSFRDAPKFDPSRSIPLGYTESERQDIAERQAKVQVSNSPSSDGKLAEQQERAKQQLEKRRREEAERRARALERAGKR